MPALNSPLMHGLLDADPSIRFQVLRDLTDAPTASVAAASVAQPGRVRARARRRRGQSLDHTARAARSAVVQP